jgi:hypothetical protein
MDEGHYLFEVRRILRHNQILFVAKSDYSHSLELIHIPIRQHKFESKTDIKNNCFCLVWAVKDGF